MRWLKPRIRSSVYGLLGNALAPTDSMLESGTEDIRESMLLALGDVGPKHFPQITRRIRYANDIQALWYLRGDLMGALAAMHGEAAAREKIGPITRMFQGLLPKGLTSRPSPLVG
jgi:predicted urease superfamily metal-dependent hydrolase